MDKTAQEPRNKSSTIKITLLLCGLALVVAIGLRVAGFDRDIPNPKIELANDKNTFGGHPFGLSGAGGGGGRKPLPGPTKPSPTDP